MSYVKNLTFHQAVSKKQLHSLRTALTREVKKETTEGHQSRWKFYTALTYMKDDVRSLKVKTENKTKQNCCFIMRKNSLYAAQSPVSSSVTSWW